MTPHDATPHMTSPSRPYIMVSSFTLHVPVVYGVTHSPLPITLPRKCVFFLSAFGNDLTQTMRSGSIDHVRTIKAPRGSNLRGMDRGKDSDMTDRTLILHTALGHERPMQIRAALLAYSGDFIDDFVMDHVEADYIADGFL